jgi:hypothetical protein
MSYVIPPGSHRIPLDQARAMVFRYNEQKAEILNPDLQPENILPVSETFRKDAIIAYLSKDFVHAIRIYYGMSENKEIHTIIVGVDKDGNDILPKPIIPGQPPTGDDDDGEIFEDAQRCPSTCPPPGWPQLNSIV